MKRATAAGMVDDPGCGYPHRIDDETAVFCGYQADHLVHHGTDFEVVVCDRIPEEIEAINR